jgi:hypothetical protein
MEFQKYSPERKKTRLMSLILGLNKVNSRKKINKNYLMEL